MVEAPRRSVSDPRIPEITNFEDFEETFAQFKHFFHDVVNEESTPSSAKEYTSTPSSVRRYLIKLKSGSLIKICESGLAGLERFYSLFTSNIGGCRRGASHNFPVMQYTVTGNDYTIIKDKILSYIDDKSKTRDINVLFLLLGKEQKINFIKTLMEGDMSTLNYNDHLVKILLIKKYLGNPQLINGDGEAKELRQLYITRIKSLNRTYTQGHPGKIIPSFIRDSLLLPDMQGDHLTLALLDWSNKRARGLVYESAKLAQAKVAAVLTQQL